MTDDQAAYVRQQFNKLGESVQYRVKIRGSKGETHWISVSPYIVGRILWAVADEEVLAQ